MLVKSKPLSSALKKQLSPAKKNQLRSGRKQQLRSETYETPENEQEDSDEHQEEDELAIDAHEDGDDPLHREQVEIQTLNNPQIDTDNDESSDDEEPGNFFHEMVGAIDIHGEEDVPGEALVQSWAEKLNLAWKTKISKTVLTAILQKYRTPSNLTDLNIPKMNREIWNMCDKWQKILLCNMY